jgi:L-asparaginase II
MRAEALFEEYRGGVLECVHYGAYALVHERDGLIRQKGDADWSCFYRSASKPIQALPVLVRGLHRKYGLTDEETAILSGSHWGDEEHVRVLESILAKAGLNEEQMVMLPAYPVRPSRKDDLLRKNAAPRKLYHNCAGKHLGLMMLARELGEPVESYWRRNSRAQREVRSMIALVSETPEDRIGVGVDGCGVPVRAARPLRRSAGVDSAGLGARARARHLTEAVRVRRRWAERLSCARVVLVDDVLTTGATFAACRRALTDAGATVVAGLVLASTPAPGRLRGS